MAVSKIYIGIDKDKVHFIYVQKCIYSNIIIFHLDHTSSNQICCKNLKKKIVVATI